jgi:uncharacterized membrane protein
MVSDALLVLGSFGACTVEMVEALTIVLAVGITRGWRSALTGVAAGFVALAAVVGALGPALVTFVPLDILRVVVGTLLLIFGMQWLRKAIQRASGLRALHDEDKIFQANISELESEGPVVTATAMDWTGFVVSFKGVFLEGLEVAFIVLTFGANSGTSRSWALSATGALLAFIIVGLVGIKVHRPLSKVPENTIKFAVGLMLMAFGTFWGGEGVGVEWSLSDGTILAALAFYGAMSYLMVRMLKARRAEVPPAAVAAGGAE